MHVKAKKSFVDCSPTICCVVELHGKVVPLWYIHPSVLWESYRIHFTRSIAFQESCARIDRDR